ncbi:MAG: hypothetical protein IIA85_02590 [Nanoarchaeota archaeon]|nr:hypothetical protein [Nanoarchaeota archaeon]
MNSEILSERKNALFGRNEIEISLESKISPSHEEVQKLVSEKISSPIENFAIKKIANRFGSNTFLVKVFVYDSEEQKNKIEPKLKAAKKK